MTYDAVVIGGGVMGNATAWHLLAAAPGLTVAVVEPDPAYAGAASSIASGGVRQLFSRPENVLTSRYTHEVIDAWARWTGPDGSGDANGPPIWGGTPTVSYSSPNPSSPSSSTPTTSCNARSASKRGSNLSRSPIAIR